MAAYLCLCTGVAAEARVDPVTGKPRPLPPFLCTPEEDEEEEEVDDGAVDVTPALPAICSAMRFASPLRTDPSHAWRYAWALFFAAMGLRLFGAWAPTAPAFKKQLWIEFIYALRDRPLGSPETVRAQFAHYCRLTLREGVLGPATFSTACNTGFFRAEEPLALVHTVPPRDLVLPTCTRQQMDMDAAFYRAAGVGLTSVRGDQPAAPPSQSDCSATPTKRALSHVGVRTSLANGDGNGQAQAIFLLQLQQQKLRERMQKRIKVVP